MAVRWCLLVLTLAAVELSAAGDPPPVHKPNVLYMVRENHSFIAFSVCV